MKQEQSICACCIVKTSKPFVCPFCNFISCKPCTKKFLLSTINDPACMNCRRTFDREILCKQISINFVDKDLKKHRENVLFDRQISMLPMSQPYVVQELKRRENQKLLETLYTNRSNLRSQIRDLDNTIFDLQSQIIPVIETERRKFTHHCAQEGCRGFLSSAWKCEICAKYTCPECNAPRGFSKDDNHVCDEEAKKSMKLIRNDCKKCPNCGEFIQKVSGCNQMWCTLCNTAFCWRTGLRLNSDVHFHNPHFYEFQQQQGNTSRVLGDIPCGGMPSIRELGSYLRNNKINVQILDYLMSVHRITNHIIDQEIGRYRMNDEDDNMDLRVRYMLKELTDNDFKMKLQQREKRTQKLREIYLVLSMFTDTVSDLFRQIVNDENKIDFFVSQINFLIKYTNKSMHVISEKYKCVVPFINTETSNFSFDTRYLCRY